MRRPLFFSLFVVLGFGLDQWSKLLVFALLAKGTAWQLIPGVLHLTLARNQGVAFSLLRNHPSLILCVSCAAIAVLVWLYATVRRTAPAVVLVALGLLLVGAMGNLADRLAYGYVRDFIDFVPPVPLVGRWAVFNVADMCITIGVALYLFGELFCGRRRPEEPAGKQAADAHVAR
jgi:signal peptidase II